MERIGVGVNEILRYFITGLLVVLALWDRRVDLTKFIFQNGKLDGAMVTAAMIVVLALGAVVFALYRVVLGEFLLYRLSEGLSIIFSRLGNRVVAYNTKMAPVPAPQCFCQSFRERMDNVFCPKYWNERIPNSTLMQYVKLLGIPFMQRRMAYRLLRSKLFTPEFRSYLNVRHGEIHVLYLLGAFSCFFLGTGGKLYCALGNWLWIVAILSLLGGFLDDYWTHSLEGDFVRNRQPFTREILRNAGFDFPHN